MTLDVVAAIRRFWLRWYPTRNGRWLASSGRTHAVQVNGTFVADPPRRQHSFMVTVAGRRATA